MDMLFRAARLWTFGVGERIVAVSPDLAEPRVLSRAELSVVQACVGYKTLDGHTEAARNSGAGAANAHGVGRQIRQLVEDRLLRSIDSDRARRGCSGRWQPITVVGIVTCNRPSLLERCLQSVIEACRGRAQPPRVLVLDSSSSDNAVHNEHIVADAARGGDIDVRYLGRAAKCRIRALLQASGIEPEKLDLCLPLDPAAPNTGTARNWLLLLSAGEQLLTIDDDVVARPRAWPQRSSGISFVGHADPCHFTAFGTRAEALAASIPSEDNLLSAHEALLGRDVADLYHPGLPDVDTASICGHLWDAIVDGGSTIGLSFTGIVGDAAVYCPHRRLLGSAEPSSVRRGLTSREVVHVATKAAVVHDSYCMAYCMGMDNRTLLPPFMPRWRNQDGVFGATLFAVRGAHYSAHVPVAVLHDSGRHSAYEGPPMRSATQSRISDVLIALCLAAPRSHTRADSDARVRRLGNELVEVGTEDQHEFRLRLAMLTAGTKANECRKGLNLVDIGARPSWWRDEMAQYMSTFLRHVERAEYSLPVEFRQESDVLASTQRYIADIGRTYIAWPDVWNAARDYARSGRQFIES